MWVPVIVACVTGGFGVVIALIQKMAKANKADHGDVIWLLHRISHKLDKHVGDKDAHT
jgi:hypothetical protein